MVRSIMYIADVGGVVYGVDGVTVVCRVGDGIGGVIDGVGIDWYSCCCCWWCC